MPPSWWPLWLLQACGVDARLSALSVPESAIPAMAAAAEAIYRSMYK